MGAPIILIAEAMLKLMHRRDLLKQDNIMEKFKGKIDEHDFDIIMKYLGEKKYIGYFKNLDGRYRNIRVLPDGMEVAEGKKPIAGSDTGAITISGGQVGIVNTGNGAKISAIINQNLQIFGQHIDILKESIKVDNEIDDFLKEESNTILDEIKNNAGRENSNIDKIKELFSKLKLKIPKYAPHIIALMNLYLEIQKIIPS